MTELIISVLTISLLLYVLFGGADFGAGILELLTRGKATTIVSNAIAPVWEANHVWLVLVIVILFVGFPSVYSTILTVLHIPVLLVLIGIILRGSAFAFRHYDIEEKKTKAIYSFIFRFSSVFTTFFLGVTLAGIILGNITLDLNEGFYAVYIHPWFNVFALSLGLFLIILFAFLANIYTLSEIDDKMHVRHFTNLAKRIIVTLVVAGAIVFFTAEIHGRSLFSAFYHSSISMISVILATIALPFLWYNLDRNKPNLLRIIAGFQTTMIVIGWFAIQFPVLINVTNGEDITIQSSVAPPETRFYMLIALGVGIMIIFPAMGYLYKTFKFSKKSVPEN